MAFRNSARLTHMSVSDSFVQWRFSRTSSNSTNDRHAGIGRTDSIFRSETISATGMSMRMPKLRSSSSRPAGEALCARAGMAHDINPTKTIEQESARTNGIPSPGRTDITADFLHTFGDVVLRDASGAQHLDRLSLLTHSSVRQRKPERHSRIVRSLLEQLGKQRERLAAATQNPVHLCHSENAGQIGRVRLGGTRIVIERTEEVGPCHLRRRLQLVRDRLLMH